MAVLLSQPESANGTAQDDRAREENGARKRSCGRQNPHERFQQHDSGTRADASGSQNQPQPMPRENRKSQKKRHRAKKQKPKAAPQTTSRNGVSQGRVNAGSQHTDPERRFKIRKKEKKKRRREKNRQLHSSQQHTSLAEGDTSISSRQALIHSKAPDYLSVTRMRATSPKLEHIVSLNSPGVLQEAASVLRALQARTARLHEQIEGFEAAQSKARETLDHSMSQEKRYARIKQTIDIHEEIIALYSEHYIMILVLEYALRDVIDEGTGLGGCKLEDRLADTRIGFQELKTIFVEKLWPLLNGLNPEAVNRATEETMQETGRKIPEVKGKDI